VATTKKKKVIKKKTVKEKEIKVVNVPAIINYTTQQVEDAIIKTEGYLTSTAKELGCPVERLKKMIKDSKRLKDILFEVKESCLDRAELELMNLVKNGSHDKSKLLAIMFYLKCQGKGRGWIDRPEGKAGNSADKPLYIKIMPLGAIDEVKKAGRPKKAFGELKILPENAGEGALEATSDIIDGEFANA
jgi:hypothetical protein